MAWDDEHEHTDVAERRHVRERWIMVLAVLAIGALIVGGYFSQTANDGEKASLTETTSANLQEEKQKHVATFVLDDAQQTWRSLFARAGKHYESAQIVLYKNETTASCGFGQAAIGPFYCPPDDRVYVDLAFNDELARRFDASAQAYVLAHEIGHHVQKLLGATALIKSFRRDQHEGEEGANVRLELQADCYAGVWAHTTEKRGLLDAGNIDQALRAAADVGEARLARRAAGHVAPETFTHGTADQRARWFKAGYEHGDVGSCDTFSASGL